MTDIYYTIYRNEIELENKNEFDFVERANPDATEKPNNFVFIGA